MHKNDQKEGLFKRLKNIENAEKNSIGDDDNERIYYTPWSKLDDKDDKYKKQQQKNNIDTKLPNFFNYLKRLSQEAKDFIDEIEDANDDTNEGKFLFIGSNEKKINFNTFEKPLNFLSAIYNGEISLREAEFSKKKLGKKIVELKLNYKPKNKKEKEELNQVLMLANHLLE